MFQKVPGKFPKKIGAAYKNSNILCKIFLCRCGDFQMAVPFFYFNEKLL